jgi:hypothetical protein
MHRCTFQGTSGMQTCRAVSAFRTIAELTVQRGMTDQSAMSWPKLRDLVQRFDRESLLEA